MLLLLALALALTLPGTALAAPAGNTGVSSGNDGVQTDGAPQPPLFPRWSGTSESRAGQAVVAGGRLFQSARLPGSGLTSVRAVDVATGRRLWSRAFSSLDDLRIVATAETVVVTTPEAVFALDAATAQTRWIREDAAGTSLDPALDGDQVFIVRPTSGSTSRMQALDVSDGRTHWVRELTGRAAAPVVGGGLVVTSENCTLVALNRTTGERAWTGAALPCVGSAPALATHAGRVVARDIVNGPANPMLVVDLADGHELSRITEQGRPVLRGDLTIGSESGATVARRLPDGAEVWRAPGVAGAMVATGATLYVASNDRVTGLDIATGAVTWSADNTVSFGSDPRLTASDGALVFSSSTGSAMWASLPIGLGLPDPTPAPTAAPTRSGSESRAFGQSPAHDGYVPGSDPAPPLARRWDRRLNGSIQGAPLTSGDTMFALVTSPVTQQRFTLVALDLQTGRTRWRRSIEAYTPFGGRLALDDGVVAVMTGGSLQLEAYSAADGTRLWRRQIYNSPLDTVIADGGRIYTTLRDPRRLGAFDLRTGEPIWESPALDLPLGAGLATDGTNVYLATGDCGPSAAVSVDDGALRWRQSGRPWGCILNNNQIEPVPTLHAGRVLIDNTVRDTADGRIVDYQPAAGFSSTDGTTRIGVQGFDLVAQDTLGRTRWVLSPGGGAPEDGFFGNRPIIVGATAYVPRYRGGVTALRVSDGVAQWSDRVATDNDPLVLAARPGTLIATAGQRIVVWGPTTSSGPEIRFDAPPASPAKERRPSFSWTATGATSQTCAVDDAAPADCTSPFRPAEDLPEGEHRITVTATGPGGTRSTSAVYTVDNTPPKTTIGAGPADFSVSDNNKGFDVTADEAGVAFECARDSETPFGDCRADVGPAGSNSEGEHSITISATDEAGNKETPAVTRRWVYDRTPPVVTFTQKPAARVRDRTQTFAFQASEPVTFHCGSSLDGSNSAAYDCTSPQTKGPYVDGDRQFGVVAKDRAGNLGYASTTFTVDNVGPATVIDAAPPESTQSSDVEVRFHAPGAASFECNVDNAGYVPCASPYAINAPAETSHAVAIRAIDDLGSPGPVTQATWRVDRTGPTITVVPPPAVVGQSPVYFDLDISEPGSFTCNLDGGPTLTNCGGFDVGEGTHSVVIRGVDQTGNVGPEKGPYTFRVDLQGATPTLTGVPPLRTRDRGASIGLSSDEPDAQFTCYDSITNGERTPCPNPLTFNGLADGTYSLRVVAKDAFGRSGPDAYATWTVDTTAPTIKIEPIQGTYVGTSAWLNLSTDGSPATTTCAVDGGAAMPCAPPAVNIDGLAPGSHRIVGTVSDDLGNTAITEATWTQQAAPGFAPGIGPKTPVVVPPNPTEKRTDLSPDAIEQLRRDIDAAVRKLTRRGRKLRSLKSVTVTSRVPAAGKLSATLRLKGKAVASGRATAKKAGAVKLVVRTTKAGRRVLRKPLGRYELKVTYAPKGASAVTVSGRATAKG